MQLRGVREFSDSDGSQFVPLQTRVHCPPFPFGHSDNFDIMPILHRQPDEHAGKHFQVIRVGADEAIPFYHRIHTIV